ncbi:unnamed protein product, partial [Choristocarpus tenellus]
VVQFPLTHVGDFREIFLEVSNPADVPVLVHLATAEGGDHHVSVTPLPASSQHGSGDCSSGAGAVGGVAEVWGVEADEEGPVFYLSEGGIGPVLLAPKGRVVLGPLCFLPDRPGTFYGHVYLRNNLTQLESVSLKG